MVTELELLVEFGREFHILGPATENGYFHLVIIITFLCRFLWNEL